MVHGLLITAGEEYLFKVGAEIRGVANYIDKRGQTTRWTVFADDLELVIAACRRHHVTLQEIVGAGSSETYETLNQGCWPVWQPGVRN